MARRALTTLLISILMAVPKNNQLVEIHNKLVKVQRIWALIAFIRMQHQEVLKKEQKWAKVWPMWSNWTIKGKPTQLTHVTDIRWTSNRVLVIQMQFYTVKTKLIVNNGNSWSNLLIREKRILRSRWNNNKSALEIKEMPTTMEEILTTWTIPRCKDKTCRQVTPASSFRIRQIEARAPALITNKVNTSSLHRMSFQVNQRGSLNNMK